MLIFQFWIGLKYFCWCIGNAWFGIPVGLSEWLLTWRQLFGYMFVLHIHYLVGEMGLGQSIQDYIHSFVYMISCLNCTAQLTGTNIVNSVRRHFKVTWSHHLAWTEGHGKNTLFCVGELWKLPSLLSFACIKNVRKQSLLKIEK